MTVFTDLPISRDGLHRMAVSAHDGMARAIVPCHTISDGDIVFAAALNESADAPPLLPAVSIATEMAVEAAIRHAVELARVNVL
ncbi:MAG: P1 family peptidase [Thermomicrobiales bacterium]